MKKIFIHCILASFSVFYSCTEPDVKPGITFEKITKVPKLIPYQTASFAGNKYPGTKEDYKVYFGNIEVPVSKVSVDSLYIFVPFEVQVGRQPVKLVYENQEYDLGNVDIADWRTVLPHSVSFFETGNEAYPYHITDELSNAIIPHIKEGKIDKLYINSHKGETSIIELNTLGLPAFFYDKEESIVFDGYNLEKGTVNIARFPTNNIEAAVYQYGILLDPEDLEVLLNANNGRFANGRKANDIGSALSIISSVFNITACIVGTATAVVAPPTTFLTGAGLVLTCGSAAYDAMKILNPDFDKEALSIIQSVHGIKMSLIDCLNLATKPKDAMELYKGIYGCYGLALDAAKGANTLYEEYRAGLERDLQKLRAVLATGYGDIKITLDWNSSADIDLWVIDPNGEKIYFDHQSSTSGGELDLDDTNGFGPENVFWPADKAPFGDYKIQVHYYGPDNGPATSYRVIINNFGKSKTFTGAITYNQVVSVAAFKAGADWSNTGGRMAAASAIEMANRSALPRK